METPKLNTENERFLEMWEWVKTEEGIKTDAELLGRLGYSSRSTISIIKGGRKVPEILINGLCDNFGVSRKYIKSGSLPKTNTGYSPDSAEKNPGKDLRDKKAFGDSDEGIKFVPITAQAGYTRHIIEPTFVEELDTIYLPKMPYTGDNYRIFEVSGDSMEPTLKEGYHVVAEYVDPEYWHSTPQFYIHVIVTEDRIMIKRLYRKDDDNFVCISDNGNYYKQFLLPKKDIKELWLVKRKMDWEMPPPQTVEIEV